MKHRYKICIIFLLLAGTVFSQGINEYITRAKAMVDRSRYFEAIDIYSTAIEMKPGYKLYRLRGDAYLAVNDIDAARTDFEKANQLVPGSGYLGLARMFSANDNIDEAVSALRKHLQSDFRIPRREIILDPFFTKLENTPEWRELWKTNWYTQLDEGIAEVEYYIREAKTARAKEVLSSIEYLYSDRLEIKYLQALVEAHENNHDRSVSIIKSALDEGFNEYNAWKLYIEELANRGDMIAAASACETALSIHPSQTVLIYMKSEYLRAANERSAALQAAEEYLNLYPEDEKAIRQAGLASAENKLFSKAIKYFSDNIEKHPSSAQNFTDRANVYLQIKSWDAAEYDYSMSLDLWPRNGDVYYNKGLALMQMGKVDQACHDFRMALRYGNNKASGMISRHCIK